MKEAAAAEGPPAVVFGALGLKCMDMMLGDCDFVVRIFIVSLLEIGLIVFLVFVIG